MVETFSDLIREVQDKGRCYRCGGCVSFCSALNYGALKLGPDGMPVYDDQSKCLECGLCYSICPQTTELDKEVRKLIGWQPPMGNIIGVGIARAKDSAIREHATDGGVVTAILTHLFDTGKIDGAIVSQITDHGRVPCLATTKEQILASAGSHFASSQGMVQFSEDYATFSPSVYALAGVRKSGRAHLAFVGTPCQINSMRKMQALDLVPSDLISYCFGLFCAGNFTFDHDMFETLAQKYGFDRTDIKKINVKDEFIFTFHSGKTACIPIAELDSVRRHACSFCDDFAAEYADISFGGIGADHGWTTAVTRTPVGRQVFDAALDTVLESYRFEDNPNYVSEAEHKILQSSQAKKQKADEFKKTL